MEDFAGKQPTPRVTRILEATVREAERYGHSYIGTEHLLLGLLSEPCGIAGQVLTKLSVADEAARQVRAILESDGYNKPSAPGGPSNA